MLLIVLNYESPSYRVSTKLSQGETVRIGRSPESDPEGNAGQLVIPWKDRLVSRNHCLARRENDTLVLSRLPALPGRGKPNVLYTNTNPRQRECLEEPVKLQPGESAVIGIRGNTVIFWVNSEDQADQLVAEYQQALEESESQSLRQQDYDEVEQLDEYSLRFQLKLLQRELPEQVLAGWTNRAELFSRAAAFIENALPGQKGVTAMFMAVSETDGSPDFECLHPFPVDRADFRPSRTLLKQLEIAKPVASDVHLWTNQEDKALFKSESLGDKIDWVVAVPVASLDENGEIHRDRDRNRPVYLYVETRQATENAAAAFLPFLRLITSLVASLLSARDQQRIQDRMSTYFSPGLRLIMRDSNESFLEPSMTDCTVLFADRRGSSHLLETARTDEKILDRLKENQEIVGIITELVFENGGVITDFAGDGALALWGWPDLEEDKSKHARRAVASAEAIAEELASRGEFEKEHARFMAAIRLGISTGRIAVGKTGPAQQWHISVFGGVANLGARLERIAKEFKIPVLLSDETYQRCAGADSRRYRKLCLIRPAGFQESYPIYELILPQEWGGSGATEQTTAAYEKALELFIERDWDGAIDLLNTNPKSDEPTIWLRRRALEFRENPLPDNWRGEIDSLSK